MSSALPQPPGAILARIVEVLHDHGIEQFAFRGGVAVGVWAVPRQTRDVDLCGVLEQAEVDRLLALRDGIRSGPGRLPDLVRFRVADWDVASSSVRTRTIARAWSGQCPPPWTGSRSRWSPPRTC